MTLERSTLVASLVLTTLLVAALAAPPPARAEPCATPTVCLLSVDQFEPCGVNDTAKGETCVQHYRVTAGNVPVAGLGGLRVSIDHEDANGHVLDFNTQNTWSSSRQTVNVTGLSTPVSVGTYGYLSASQPTSGSAGQVERTVFVGDATSPATLAGFRILIHNLEPAHCIVHTPDGPRPVPCQLTPVYELLP